MPWIFVRRLYLDNSIVGPSYLRGEQHGYALFIKSVAEFGRLNGLYRDWTGTVQVLKKLGRQSMRYAIYSIEILNGRDGSIQKIVACYF